MDAKSYTRLLRSSIFQELHVAAQAHLMNTCHAIDDSTLVGAAKANFMRKGGELVLNYLVTQRTMEQEAMLDQMNAEPDYGAEEILRKTMNP